jgi:hypothetical protein
MTTRPTFGDFAAAASQQIRQATGPPGSRSTPVSDADDVARSLGHLVTVMARYAADIGAATRSQRPAGRSQAGPWERAGRGASETLRHAATILQPDPAPAATGPRWPGRARQQDPAARRLDAAATALTTGRDLLHTHLALQPGGELRARSEWAPVILSAPVTRALLHELASWAHQLAPLGSQRALARAPAHGTPQARRKLAAASQWLWVLYWSVQAADEHDPLPAGHIDLLHAIPASALTPRHLPDGTEPITRLCQGTITTAERVRHHARAAIPRASWSPALTLESLRETADYATVVSHNCQLLLTTLATDARQHRAPCLTTPLADAAEAAGEARQAWIRAALAWNSLLTDTRGTRSRTARETAGLALWTGRLAYASPTWNPTAGPAHPPRPATNLAPRRADMPAVIAAVHHAQDTLTQLADADHHQLRTASLTGRLLLPAPALPEFFDTPYIYGPAHAASAEPLLTAYYDARTASARATARHEPGPGRPGTTPRDLTRSAGTAEIISHMLASGDPRALALLHPPEPAHSREAEIEH